MSLMSASLPLVALVAFAAGWWWRHKKAIGASAKSERDARILREQLVVLENEREQWGNGDHHHGRGGMTTPLDETDALDERPISVPPSLPFDASGVMPLESDIATAMVSPPAEDTADASTSAAPTELLSRSTASAVDPERRTLKAAVERERSAKIAALAERDAAQTALATEQARRVVDAKSRETVEKSLRQAKAKLEDAKRELFEERRAHGETHAALDDHGEKIASLKSAVDSTTGAAATEQASQDVLEDVRHDLAAARAALTRAKVEVNEARDEAERIRSENAELTADMAAAKAGYAAYERELADALTHAPRSPHGAPTRSRPDDLTQIKGVGKKLAATLSGLGITTFAEIAAWSDDDVAHVSAQIGRFGNRVTRDDWRAQAKRLTEGESHDGETA